MPDTAETTADPADAPEPTPEPPELGTPDPLEPPEPDAEPELFPREVVAALRKENAGHRERARDATARADALAAELWHERVAALGMLADPTDLPFDADALADPAAIRAAAEQLVAAKPHLRSRRITTRVGQGEPTTPGAVSLSGLLRRNA